MDDGEEDVSIWGGFEGEMMREKEEEERENADE